MTTNQSGPLIQAVPCGTHAPITAEQCLKGFHVWVENSHDIVAEITREGVLVYVSPNVKTVLGYDANEVRGTNVLAHAHQDDLAELRARLIAPEGWATCRYRHQDGSWRWLELSAREPLAPGGGNVWVVARDITGRKWAEDERLQLREQLRQAQKLELLGTLAAGVAHDFNNLLSAIILNANLARFESAGRPAAEERLDDILTASQRATNLVRQILAFTRQEIPERQPIPLQPVISEVLKLLRPTLPATIEVRVDVRDNTSQIVADATEIHQVLMNLCTNAAHAISPNRGRIDVRLDSLIVDGLYTRTQPKLGEGSYVRLSVSDNGSGMDADTLQRIFEPFYTSKSRHHGTGLGLAIVQRIVKQHNGAIHVSSEPGRGTAFELFFPRHETRPERK